MATLEFNRKLYKRAVIRDAMRTYQEFADFELQARDRYYAVSVKSEDPQNEKVITNEFGNYVLTRTIENRKTP